MISALLSLAAGYLVALVVYWILERDQKLRRFWVQRFSTALTLGLVMWKLTPLWTRWEVVFDNPILLLSMNGGLAALLGGAFSFLTVVALSLFQVRKELPGTRRWPVWLSAAAGSLLVACWTLLEPVIVPRVGFEPGPATSTLVPDFEGKSHALADWRSKVVVVNFWASWCTPCLAELPEFQTYAQALPPTVVLVGVNLTATEKGGPAAVVRFAAQKKMTWIQLSDPQAALQKAFAVTTIPTTVVLNPAGQVVDRREGAIDLFWLKGLEARFASH